VHRPSLKPGNCWNSIDNICAVVASVLFLGCLFFGWRIERNECGRRGTGEGVSGAFRYGEVHRVRMTL
jgi:hypothetical protein